MKFERIASCSCGQLTAVASGEPVRVSICHCLACQRRTGSVFGAQARFRREHVEVKGRSSIHVRVADSGNTLTFHFDRLRHAALVTVRREGRSMIYAARFDTMNDLIGYLSKNCCGGEVEKCVPKTKAQKKSARRKEPAA